MAGADERCVLSVEGSGRSRRFVVHKRNRHHNSRNIPKATIVLTDEGPKLLPIVVFSTKEDAEAVAEQLCPGLPVKFEVLIEEG